MTLMIVMIVQSGVAAEVAGGQPEQHADAGRQQHRGDAHHQRHAASVDHAGEQVAPDLVGAQHVVGRAAAPSRPAAHSRWRMFTASGSCGR